MEKINSNQWWNNDKWQCECKKHHVCKKDYICNSSTCSCENRKYLASVMDDSVITSCYAICNCNVANIDVVALYLLE